MSKMHSKPKQRTLDKPGRAVLLRIPFGQKKPYYETSIGKIKACAEWRDTR